MHCRARVGDRVFEERHQYHLMAIVQQGTFTYHGERGRSLLHSGAILLGHRNSCYCCGHQHSDGDHCLALQIDDELFAEISCLMAGSACHRFSASAIAVDNSLLPVVTRLAIGPKAAMEEAAFAFAASVVRHVSGNVPRNSISLADELRIERVLKFVEAASNEPLDLGCMAKLSGLSRFHFLRVFNNVTGSTPYQHVLRSRLRKAAHTLSSGRTAIAAIAFDCGFGDLSTFNRTFKAVYGMSPGEFRRRELH